ncbi:hypothetical protein CGG93_24735 [Vibrio parahaemolyticus]|nr:hypothetical protein CGK30_24315 [Vibrio parahaemolyticus]TOQ56023.1 hypothetical protein CGG93_24735 [Vibrio parahaemolyticus]
MSILLGLVEVVANIILQNISSKFDENGEQLACCRFIGLSEYAYNKLFKSDSQRVAFLPCVGLSD